MVLIFAKNKIQTWYKKTLRPFLRPKKFFPQINIWGTEVTTFPQVFSLSH